MKTLNKKEEIQRLCKLLSQDQAIVFCLDASLRCLSTATTAHAADAASYAGYAAAVAYVTADAAAYAASDAAYVVDADAANNESIEVLKYILKGKK